jgi:hypothetical protein
MMEPATDAGAARRIMRTEPVPFRRALSPAERIERLEARIEELREAIRRSRLLMMAGRACAVVGPALLLCFILGLLAFTPARMVAALALAIGGMVLSGSSRSSTEQLEISLRRAEYERSAVIDASDLIEPGNPAD